MRDAAATVVEEERAELIRQIEEARRAFDDLNNLTGGAGMALPPEHRIVYPHAELEDFFLAAANLSASLHNASLALYALQSDLKVVNASFAEAGSDLGEFLDAPAFPPRTLSTPQGPVVIPGTSNITLKDIAGRFAAGFPGHLETLQRARLLLNERADALDEASFALRNLYLRLHDGPAVAAHDAFTARTQARAAALDAALAAYLRALDTVEPLSLTFRELSRINEYETVRAINRPADVQLAFAWGKRAFWDDETPVVKFRGYNNAFYNITTLTLVSDGDGSHTQGFEHLAPGYVAGGGAVEWQVNYTAPIGPGRHDLDIRFYQYNDTVDRFTLVTTLTHPIYVFPNLTNAEVTALLGDAVRVGAALQQAVDGFLYVEDSFEDFGTLPHGVTNLHDTAAARAPSTAFLADPNGGPTALLPQDAEVVDLAFQLSYDPSRIYSYVRDAIRLEAYYGSLKGPVGTLAYGAGNALDQAALAVALLQASGAEARIVTGVVTMPEATLAALYQVHPSEVGYLLRSSGIPHTESLGTITLEHAWVSYRTGLTWTSFDPSFSVVIPATAPTEGTVYPLDGSRTTTITRRVTDADGTYRRLEAFVQQPLEGELASIDTRYAHTPIPLTLPFTVVGILSSTGEVPPTLEHRFRFSYGNLTYDAPTAQALQDAPGLGFQWTGARFGAVEVTPAYLLRAAPALVVDGVVQDVDTPVPAGAILPLQVGVYAPAFGWMNRTDGIVAGRAVGFAVEAGFTTPAVAQRDVGRTRLMNMTTTPLEIQESAGHVFHARNTFLLASYSLRELSDSYLVRMDRARASVIAAGPSVEILRAGEVVQHVVKGALIDTLDHRVLITRGPQQASPYTRHLLSVETLTRLAEAETGALRFARAALGYGGEPTSPLALLRPDALNPTERVAVSGHNLDAMDALALPTPVVRLVSAAVDRGYVVAIQRNLTGSALHPTVAWTVMDPASGATGLYQWSITATDPANDSASPSIGSVARAIWEVITNDELGGLIGLVLSTIQNILTEIRTLNVQNAARAAIGHLGGHVEEFRRIYQTAGRWAGVLNVVGIILGLFQLINNVWKWVTLFTYFDEHFGALGADYFKPSWSYITDAAFAVVQLVADAVCASGKLAELVAAPETLGASLLLMLATALTCYVVAKAIGLGSQAAGAPTLEVSWTGIEGGQECQPVVLKNVKVKNTGQHIAEDISVYFYVNGQQATSINPPNRAEIEAYNVPSAGEDYGDVSVPIVGQPQHVTITVRAFYKYTYGDSSGTKSYQGPEAGSPNEKDIGTAPDFTTYLDVSPSGRSITSRAYVIAQNECELTANVATSAGPEGTPPDSDSGTISRKPGAKSSVTAGNDGSVRDQACPRGTRGSIPLGVLRGTATYTISFPGGQTQTDSKSASQPVDKPCPENPDDNVDPYPFQEARQIDLTPFYERSVDVLLLDAGFSENMGILLKENGVQFDRATRSQLTKMTNGTLAGYRVLVLPSASLYLDADSTAVAATLQRFVDHGGRIVVFSQETGQDWLTVPGQPSAYGFAQSVSCVKESSYIDTYHPILASQYGTLFDINLDGTFRSVPEGGEVITRRSSTGRGQADLPTAIVYPVGEGHVLAVSYFPDAALGLGVLQEAAKEVLRDMVNWGRARGPIGLGPLNGTFRTTVDVVNYEHRAITLGANSTTGTPGYVHLIDPYGRVARIFNLTDFVPADTVLPAGGRVQATLATHVPATFDRGLWRVQYSFRGWDRMTASWFSVTNITTLALTSFEASRASYNLSTDGYVLAGIFNPVHPFTGTAVLSLEDRFGGTLLQVSQPLAVDTFDTANVNFTFRVPDEALSGAYKFRLRLLDNTTRMNVTRGTTVNGIELDIVPAVDARQHRVRDEATTTFVVRNKSPYPLSEKDVGFLVRNHKGVITHRLTGTLAVPAFGSTTLRFSYQVAPFGLTSGERKVANELFWHRTTAAFTVGPTPVVSDADFAVPTMAVRLLETTFDRPQYGPGMSGMATFLLEASGGIDLNRTLLDVGFRGVGTFADDIVRVPDALAGSTFTVNVPFTVAETASTGPLGVELTFLGMETQTFRIGQGTAQTRVTGIQANLGATFDQAVAENNATFSGNLTVRNVGAVPINATLIATFRMPSLEIASEVRAPVNVGLDGTATVPFGFLVDTTYSGRGALDLELVKSGVVLTSARRAFEVDADSVFITRIGVNESYFEGETVRASLEVANLLDTRQENLLLTLNGYETVAHPLFNLGPRETRTLHVNFTVPFGIDREAKALRATVRDGDGALLTEIGTTFQALRLRDYNVTFQSSLSRPVLEPSETQTVNWTLRNFDPREFNGDARIRVGYWVELDFGERIFVDIMTPVRVPVQLRTGEAATGLVTYTAPANLAPRVYSVIGTAEKFSTPIRTDEDTFIVPGDAAIIRSTTLRPTYDAGTRPVINVTVENTGTSTLRDLEIRLEIPTISENRTTVTLGPGEAYTASFRVTLPRTLLTSFYDVDASASRVGRLLAHRENVTYIRGLAGAVTIESQNEDFYLPGDRVDLNVRLHNTGIFAYENAVLTIAHGRGLTTQFPFLNVEVNGTRFYPFNVTLSPETPPGQLRFPYQLVTGDGVIVTMGNLYVTVVGPNEYAGVRTHTNYYGPGQAVHVLLLVRNVNTTATLTGSVNFNLPGIVNITRDVTLGPRTLDLFNVDFRLPQEMLTGLYPATITVKDGSRVVYTLTHELRVNGITALITDVAPSEDSYLGNETATLRVRVQNRGPSYLDGVTNVSLVNPETGQVLATAEV
ncbi:MAG TPA: transglutaminase domain-containing protein, partial [Candidatus Thermoplasmatota archaeon]|nr:transglutaminase domain-containing protein [Candidatus Thermoplasmatota archaeon]